MKRIARAVVVGTITVGMAVGMSAPAQAKGLCSAYWAGIHMPCQMF